MRKPKFEEINYDPGMICWGKGNNVIAPNLIARIQLREPTKKEDKEELRRYNEGKDIYEKFINKGQLFRASGKRASSGIVCKITYINEEKQSVSWKQCNMSDDEILGVRKPAAGKFSINAFIQLFKGKEIEFLTPNPTI
ncbi:MAG: hypothetical protein KW793_04745 [Candidatus Doudnabacteria bacterium]|nr:hypothetical protein [Candidatus Doudnabacteria bacterium]